MLNTKKEELVVIVAGCKRGEAHCQKWLFETYFDYFFNICLRYCQFNEVQAQDMVQTGFIKIFNSIQKFDNKGSFEAWMKRIIVNNAIDFWRKQQHLVHPLNDEIYQQENEDETNTFNDIPSQIIEELGMPTVMQVINGLSAQYRIIFQMQVIDGFTHKEIAEKLNISEGTSKSNLYKAKNNIKKKLLQLLEKQKL